MALLWENPASTTHSLTPSPSNRPLIFWILTPCEKPVATGSAGRCDLGVGRFTDPHPLTCCEITPLSTAWFLGEMLRFLEELHADQAVQFFLFCHIVMVCFTPLRGRGRISLFLGLSGSPYSFTTGSRWTNNACLGSCWCYSLLASKNAHKATQSRVPFLLQNEFTPPPKGGGAGVLSCSAQFLVMRSSVLFRRKRRILRIRGLL